MDAEVSLGAGWSWRAPAAGWAGWAVEGPGSPASIAIESSKAQGICFDRIFDAQTGQSSAFHLST
jgi:hypothetical protein